MKTSQLYLHKLTAVISEYEENDEIEHNNKTHHHHEEEVIITNPFSMEKLKVLNREAATFNDSPMEDMKKMYITVD